MLTTRPNPRLAKIHRNYTVEEIATLYCVHRNTVRAWIKGGLRTVDDRRPLLVLGRDLADYLHRRRQSSKRPCPPGQIYCLRCREPRAPAGGHIEYRAMTADQGNLAAHCAVCGTRMFRRISLAKLPLFRNELVGTPHRAARCVVLRTDGSPQVERNEDHGEIGEQG